MKIKEDGTLERISYLQDGNLGEERSLELLT